MSLPESRFLRRSRRSCASFCVFCAIDGSKGDGVGISFFGSQQEEERWESRKIVLLIRQQQGCFQFDRW